MSEPPRPSAQPDDPRPPYGDPGSVPGGYPQAGAPWGPAQGGQQGGYAPQGGYPQGGYAPHGDHPQGDRPWGDRPWGDQPWGDQPWGGAPPGGHPQPGAPTYPPGGGFGGYEEFGGSATPAGPGLGVRLGARLRVRPEPRFGISLAAAGVGIAVVGIVVWSVGYLVQGVHLGQRGLEGDSRRFLGFALSSVLVVAGYAVAVVRKRGPLATAAAVGAAIGVPLAMIFVTLDLSSPGSDGLPFNTDLTYVMSVIVYLASYFLVPGMRGRAFLLGLAALQFASYVEFKTASSSVARASASIFGPGTADPGDFGLGAVTAVALVFGLVYLGLAAYLDVRGLHGAATALVVAGTATVLAGVGYGVLTFTQVGTGVELIVLGAALSWYGARFGRRFTTWFWMFALVAGVGLVVQKALPTSPAGAGVTLLVVGLVVVGLAQLLTTLTHEAPDIDDGATPEPARVGGHRH